MVDRVPWVRYDGDDIEAVVAMMVNREHPDSVRIAASQGDGGVDIVDRGAAPDGGDVVYQIKGFAERKALTASDKAKILDSMKTALDPEAGDPRWSNLHVTQWRLVIPLDPTPEDFVWLERQAESLNVKVVWDGLTVVDQLAAKYGDVIDYYLHGGKSAIQTAYKEAMALMSLSSATNQGAATSVPEVASRIQVAFGVLDRDPHYTYELRMGQGQPPAAPNRPRLVLSAYEVNTTKATWLAVDVIARCAASLDERPITINGQLDLSNGQGFAEVVREFFEFGTPFTSPEGAFSGVLDAPGGLGGEMENATVQTFQTQAVDVGQNSALTLQVLTPEGDVAAQIEVDRTDRSSGSAGLRTVLTETSGALQIVIKFDLEKQRAHLELKLREIEGTPIGQVMPSIEAFAAFCPPNSFRIFERHTPDFLGRAEQIAAGSEGHSERVRAMMGLLRALNVIQMHVRTKLSVPPASEFNTDGKGWVFAAAILEGKSVLLQASEGDVFHVVLPAGTTAPTTSFQVRLPLTVRVGGENLDLGTVRGELTNPELLDEKTLNDGRVVYSFQTPNRTIGYLPDVGDEDAHKT